MPLTIQDNTILNASNIGLVRLLDREEPILPKEILPGDIVRVYFNKKSSSKHRKGMGEGSFLLIYEVSDVNKGILRFKSHFGDTLNQALKKFLKDILREEEVRTLFERHSVDVSNESTFFLSEIKRMVFLGRIICFDNIKYKGKYISELRHKRIYPKELELEI